MTTTGPEMKPDRHPTSLTKAPIIPQITTQGQNENKATEKAQAAPWKDKNLLQKAEGALDPSRLPSTKVRKKIETWDNDHSLTLVVDDDYYEQEKENVEVNHFSF
jgi:hypothetical protein